MSSSSTDQDITDSTTGFCLPAESYCSLISHQYVNPALPDGHPFTDVFSGYYWTASACRRLTDQAWCIHMGGCIYRGMKYSSYMVWPVAAPNRNDRQISNRFLIKNRTV
jgi:hypothetical protein